ncbi:MAG: cbb3-type cytochrome c oxidase subunit 1 CcoN [Candidatus Scalindua rubra]|uniref:Cbb3-type cytochrome c oxidase subunit 1 CcoN n=1 Tax=Candidatus Scalindua rubra TaxID=1872076 RepID=A0A1E3XG61_9BACT|nr:MAG: cbb3-type cytochrome c oxidase subunit 1 CcoN [Candidatus Scalindua rubra]
MITCFQGPFQSLFSLQKVIHFSDWVVGHAHIAFLGTFSFWMIAALYYVLPRMSNRTVYTRNLAEWHFWLTFAGTLIYTSSLTAAGLVQGYLWLAGTIFMDVVRVSKPYWVARSFGGALVIIGQVVFVYDLMQNAIASQLPYLKGGGFERWLLKWRDLIKSFHSGCRFVLLCIYINGHWPMDYSMGVKACFWRR